MIELHASPDDLERSRILRQAIIEEIQNSPDGKITYGDFVSRSMNGYDADITGYYTQPDFAPNSRVGGFDANSYGTFAYSPGTGLALGEFLASRSLLPTNKGSQFELVEVGGGDGKMAVNLFVGFVAKMHLRGNAPITSFRSIDRTPQLLQRQLASVAKAKQEPKNHLLRKYAGVHTTVLADIADYRPQPIPNGAVFSNELLDMLPLEVAVRKDKPSMMFVGLDDDGNIKFKFDPATAEHEEECVKALSNSPNRMLKSFQPGLIKVMQSLCDLVDRGSIMTIDYGTSDVQDVQITRPKTDRYLGIELDYPGLFDISTAPDWSKINSWAKQQFGEEKVEFGNINDITANSQYTNGIEAFMGRRMPDTPKEVKRMLELMFKEFLKEYAFTLISK